MLARTLAPLALALASTGCSAAPEPAATEQLRPTVGLMTSLPIYWAGEGEFGAMLASDAPPGWVRSALEERHTLEPLDTLEESKLAGLALLLLAQPRPLSPAENIALDAWVRGGGRLLLFADPMLTAHSDYPIGDPRRPQDVALLSPILRHWGLDLQFDTDQPEGERSIALGGTSLPVNLAGRFTSSDRCRLEGSGIIAECALGKGRITAVADGALFEDVENTAGRREALHNLLQRAFD